jgi:hypothetical protein
MQRTIGLNFPILTFKEYQALKNARWYAYNEMCKNPDGTYDRSRFNYQVFIRSLYAHSDPALGSPLYWNIDPKTAKDIMMAFGFDSTGNMISSPIAWSPVKRYGEWVPYHTYTSFHSIGLMGWWARFADPVFQAEMGRKFDTWL